MIVSYTIPILESTHTITVYRVTYGDGDIGIYEQLKNAMWKSIGSSKAWVDFVCSDAAKWLPKPPEYKDSYRSYFTKDGYDMYMQKTYPVMVKYLDKKKIKIDSYTIDTDNIVYKDRYQIVSR